MSGACPLPDPSVGIAVRLSDYLDCQARVLGENGYLALAGGPVGTALLTASLTILVALVGYRLVLGERPSLRDGVGWALRAGIALALLGSWPAFQTLVFRTVTDGPVEVASAILGPSGLPSSDLAGRVQAAYDTIRLGSSGPAVSATPATGEDGAPEQRFQFKSAAPRTAVAFLVGTVGLLAAIRICIGFLLAIGPLPILTIILSGGRGLFLGWARVLAGTAFAAVGATTITAVELVLVESELARLQSFGSATPSEIVDVQALAAIVFTCMIMAIVTALAAMRVASRIDFGSWSASAPELAPAALPQLASGASTSGAVSASEASQSRSPRERDMARLLLTSVRREQTSNAGSATAASTPRLVTTGPGGESSNHPAPASAGRRRAPRRTRSSLRREARS